MKTIEREEKKQCDVPRANIQVAEVNSLFRWCPRGRHHSSFHTVRDGGRRGEEMELSKVCFPEPLMAKMAEKVWFIWMVSNGDPNGDPR